MKNISLNNSTLNQIAKNMQCPSYQRDNLKAGIVHIGVGGFHRSHLAYYIHQLLQNDLAFDFSICGVGLREADRKMYDILKRQDYLYTLMIQHPNGDVKSEVVGSMTDYILAVDTPDLLIEKLVSLDTKIVSLTITEGGYNFNPTTGGFNFENPDIQYELKNPNSPKSMYGFLTLALRKRRALNIPPFTILSCDNIQHNGDVTRNMFLEFSKKSDVEFASWMEDTVCFPNTMVDRITPVTTAADITYLVDTYHVEDEWPVTCEPFIQWVVEDHFSMGRPAFEDLGVQFVKDVSPYEKMKIRLLNAGHSVLGIPGAIHGHLTILDCMNDVVFKSFMRQFMDMEVTPVLDVVDGIDLDSYKESLEERFANPNIKDRVSRICSESSAKLPKFLIPTLLENLRNNGSIKYATFILAAWCYYSDKRIDQEGQVIEIIDNKSEELHEISKQTAQDNLAFLNIESLFGDLIHNERFTTLYTRLIQEIYSTNNIRHLMEKML